MPPSQHMRRIRERVLEHVREHGRERAYTDGIEETSNRDDIIFIDPDKLTSENPEKLLKQFLKQMKGQFDERFETDAKEVLRDGNIAEAFILFADGVKKDGPAVLSEVGVAIMPSSEHETKEAYLRTSFENIFDDEIIDSIIENMPGNDKDWNRIVGNHEGTHLTIDPEYSTVLDKLIEEERADAGAIAAAENRGQSDMAFARRDVRHLRANIDTSHATGTPLISGDPVSQLHVEAAKSFDETMDDVVDETFDWENYEGEATTPTELFKENPEAYFDALGEGIDEGTSNIKNALATYDEPLSFDETKEIVALQIEIDYMKNFEGAYRRRIMGQDVPEHEPTQFISQEAENVVYAAMKEQNKPTAAELEQEQHQETVAEENNIPEQAFEGFDWESYEGEATTTGELLFEDHDLYYKVQVDYLKEIQDNAQAQYDADPSYENTQQLIETQILINNRYESMEKYREDILEETVVLHEPLELISEGKQDAYYEERANRNATPEAQPESTEPATTVPEAKTKDITDSNAPIIVEPKEAYEEGVNDSAYTTEVSGITSGAPSVDFEKGVTVSGAPITNVFAEMANPDPNDIKLVDARMTTPEEQFALPPQEAQNDANLSITA